MTKGEAVSKSSDGAGVDSVASISKKWNDFDSSSYTIFLHILTILLAQHLKPVNNLSTRSLHKSSHLILSPCFFTPIFHSHQPHCISASRLCNKPTSIVLTLNYCTPTSFKSSRASIPNKPSNLYLCGTSVLSINPKKAIRPSQTQITT